MTNKAFLVDANGQVLKATGKTLDSTTGLDSLATLTAAQGAAGGVGTAALNSDSQMVDAAGNVLFVKRPAVPVLAVIGDSRAAHSFYTSGTTPVNLQVKRGPDGFGFWVEFLSNRRILQPYGYCFAVSSTQVSDLPGQITNLLAVSPRPTHCAVLTGTNSFANGVSAVTAYGQLAVAMKKLTDAGIIPIVIVDVPRGLSSWTAANQRQSQQFNQMVYWAAQSLGCYVVDPTYAIADPASTSGDPLTNYYAADKIHPAVLGAYYIGNEVVNVIAGSLPGALPGFGSNADVFDTTHPTETPWANILQNGLFTGTAGTNTSSGGVASGTVPSLWNSRTLTGTGTAVSSIVARTDGKPGNWWQIVVTDSSGGSSGRLSLITPPSIAAGYFAAGDKLAMEMDVAIVSGGASVQNLQPHIVDWDGTATLYDDRTAIGTPNIAGAYFPFPDSFSGRCRTTPALTLAGASTAGCLVRIDWQCASAGTFTLRLGRADLRRLQAAQIC